MFEHFLPFLIQNHFKIHNKKTRISFSLYSSKRRTSLLSDFTEAQSYDTNKMKTMLKRQTPVHTYFGTNLQTSLTIARENVFVPQAGDRSDKHNVLVIFGDGKNFPYKYLPDYVQPLKVRK